MGTAIPPPCWYPASASLMARRIAARASAVWALIRAASALPPIPSASPSGADLPSGLAVRLVLTLSGLWRASSNLPMLP